ncbi:MAG TPA: hypothetical protein VEK33_08110 [Terriglobales bacterium]|nr:hypothetical protein [Terriglobales bacterium]
MLPVVSVLLPLGLSPSFLHGLFAYSPNLFFFVSCWNLVPEAILSVISPHENLYWTHGRWALFLFWQYEFTVFLFWCWVGWKIDLRAASRDCGSACTITEILLGVALSITMFALRFRVLVPPYREAGPWIAMAWSLVILCYSLLRLSNLWTATRQPPDK